MRLKYRLLKAYREFLYGLSASENPLFMAYCRYIYKPRRGTVKEFIDNYSRRKGEVTFLQVGANDGFVYDLLHWFIKRDRWRGVMLEPQPMVCNNYLVRLHAKRPEITVINAALDRKDGSRKIYKLAFSNERWAHGLSSFSREVLENKLDDGSLVKHIRRQGVKLPENREECIVAEDVATISPETLLEKFEGGTFDLLAIDAEGYDYEILKMLDLARISPEVIIYENTLYDTDTVDECRNYLESFGYKWRTFERDALAVKSRQA